MKPWPDHHKHIEALLNEAGPATFIITSQQGCGRALSESALCLRSPKSGILFLLCRYDRVPGYWFTPSQTVWDKDNPDDGPFESVHHALTYARLMGWEVV